jgi:PAS domain S-box-containing protein
VLAALAVAFSMAPAHGRMQRVANRLFINLRAMDIRDALQKANQALMSIGTVDELLDRFARIVMDATGTDHLLIFLAESGAFRRAYPPESDVPRTLPAGEPLFRLLGGRREALAVDALRRMRPSGERADARARLEELRAAVGVGIFAKEKMEGALLLGQRLSGRFYGVLEQEALQLLCDQLGVALENARLYTESQNSRIYNDILLDSLVSGIVAANSEKRVTVFNRAAQRITGLTAGETIGRPADVLPAPIASALASELAGEAPLMHEDADITVKSGERISIRVSSSRFHGHTGEPLGALAVFEDMTAVKKLEEQVRRTDRLASLGTLSAGMAHEIKNPLVSSRHSRNCSRSGTTTLSSGRRSPS